MSLTQPLHIKLWQSAGEADLTNVTSVSPIATSPLASPTADGGIQHQQQKHKMLGKFDLIKSKSTLDTTSKKSPPYPTQIESIPSSIPSPKQTKQQSKPSIRRVLSSIDIPSHTSLHNKNITTTVYTPPVTTRTLISSPSYDNIVSSYHHIIKDIKQQQKQKRQRGIQKTSYLYAGATYHGQQSVYQRGCNLAWDVHVSIMGVDMRHGMVMGMMQAYDVPGTKKQVITTYWEGQIIDNINYSFFTGNWDITYTQDIECWENFIAYVPIKNLVEQQQHLMETCYAYDEHMDERKPDEHTAERIYAKLQQLKRLAQQPPPRVECSDDTNLFDIPSCDEAEAEVSVDLNPDTINSSTENDSDETAAVSHEQEQQPEEEEESTSSFDELACIAAHHRLTRYLNHSRYIYMRWKEIAFDETTTTTATGLSIDGHYNVVMDRMDGSIVGVFQDQRSCNQRLVLKHVVPSHLQGQSFSEYHFHH